ncbi:STAS/SEC14 domain-containing protein [candidate division WOR-3 bacterium]|nr:STAS/SEC14 domain-containing protein [candidate division WOR-3 bacterium]
MKHKVYFDEVNNIPRIDIHGRLEVEDIAPLVENIEQILKAESTGYLLSDVSDLPSYQIDRKTRRALQERGKVLGLTKIAMLGASPAIRMIARLVIKLLGGETAYHFFSEEKEAVAWLKGNRYEIQGVVRRNS